MVTFKISNTLIKAARLPLVLSLFSVVSCSSDKPEYDLGPRRSPQDNQSIIRQMTTKPEAPKPLIPGYDIPAPRYQNQMPRMIDVPGYPPAPSMQQPIPPQSFAPPAMQQSVAKLPYATEIKRRPIKQFSGPVPGLATSQPMGSMAGVSAPMTTPAAINVASRPVFISQPEKKERLSFFDRIKSIFKKKEKPEPKRVPSGQGHLATMGQQPIVQGTQTNGKGFSVESNEPRLEDELKGFPQTPAERAADVSVPEQQEVVPEGKAIITVPSQTPKTVQAKGNPVQYQMKTPNDWAKKDVQPKKDPATAVPKPFSFPFKFKPSEAPKKSVVAPVKKDWSNPDVASAPTSTPSVNEPLKFVAPVAPGASNKSLHEQIEERWQEQQKETQGSTLWEDKKLDNRTLEELPETPKPVYNKPTKPTANKASQEEAEVLMEFDISEDGELVGISDVAPAAGKEDASASILQEVVEPAKPSTKQ